MIKKTHIHTAITKRVYGTRLQACLEARAKLLINAEYFRPAKSLDYKLYIRQLATSTELLFQAQLYSRVIDLI